VGLLPPVGGNTGCCAPPSLSLALLTLPSGSLQTPPHLHRDRRLLGEEAEGEWARVPPSWGLRVRWRLAAGMGLLTCWVHLLAPLRSPPGRGPLSPESKARVRLPSPGRAPAQETRVLGRGTGATGTGERPAPSPVPERRWLGSSGTLEMVGNGHSSWLPPKTGRFPSSPGTGSAPGSPLPRACLGQCQDGHLPWCFYWCTSP